MKIGVFGGGGGHLNLQYCHRVLDGVLYRFVGSEDFSGFLVLFGFDEFGFRLRHGLED